ncbi:30S ribosomal protein S9 [Candidatus Woesearchaeota archaeon]|nr:30S ribosomal protein S9 [Candidatus Woesearchaeota archaeon]
MKSQTQNLTKGKRKCAVARASLKAGTGRIFINGQGFESFGNSLLRMRVSEPLVLAGPIAHKVDIAVIINGGGVSSQADAARLAIARVLVEEHEELKKVFTDYDRLLLVADVRRKESCKPNDSKARAKRQKSYR